MNSIYKVIWSKAKNCYVVASEIAKSHTKSASGQSVRRSALASLLALSLLCGGLGVASASLEVVDQSGTAGTVTIYTKDEVDHALTAKGAATDVAKNTADIATNKANITKLENDKLSKDVASATYATKDALNDLTTTVNGKADESTVATALDGKANKADTLAGYGITDAYTKGDVDDKLNAKADAANVFTKDQTYTRDQVNTKLADYAKLADVYTKTDADAKFATSGALTTAKTELEGKINDEKTAREAEDNKINTKIGSIDDTRTQYVKESQTISQNLTKLDEKLQETNERTAGIEYDKARDETTIGGQVTVNSIGDVTARGQLTAKGGVNAGNSDITTTGEVNAGSLNVENASHLKGDVTMDNNLTVKGDTSLKGTKVDGKLTVTDDADLKNTKVDGTLTTTGKATFQEAVEMDKGLTVTNGDTKLKATTVDGKLTAGDADLKNTKVDGTLGVTGDTTLDGALTAKGEAKFEKNVTVEKDLTVNGKLNVGEIYLENNKLESTGKQHNSATSITADGISNLAKVTELGHTTESQFTHNEKGTFNYAKDGDSTDWTETRSDVTANGVNTEVKDSKGNRTNTSQTASENKTYLEDKDGKNTNSTIDTAKGYDKTIKGENGETSTKQDELNITNTAQKGTITNDAKDIVNNATGNMTNTVGGKLTTTVTGATEENYNGGLTTKVTGEEKHTVTGKQTNTVEGGQENIISGGQTNTITGGQVNNITGDQTTTITGNKKETVTENVTEDYKKNLTTTVGGNEIHEVKGTKTETVEGKVTENFKGGQETNVTGDQTTNVSGTQTTNATDINRNASSGMIDKVDNDYGTNTETKVAGKTTTDVSIKGTGEKGQYIRGANESRDYLIKGTLKNSETKTAETTSTEITDGNGNISATIQDAKNLAGSVNNGTETGISGIHANDDGSVSIDSIVTDGSTSSVINQKKDSIQSAVGDGNSSTVIRQDKDNVTIASSNGTVAIGGKDIINNAQDTITNTAGTKITDTAGDSTVTTENGKGTTFSKTGSTAYREGGPTDTNISGNTITTGKVTMDYAEVMKDLGVRGNANIAGKTTTGELEVTGKSTLKGDVTMESNATVKKDLTVEGTTTTKTLKVTENATVGGTLDVAKKATFQDAVDIAKDLSVGGNATIKGDVTAKSYKVGDKTYISADGINANDQKITNVADGSISEGSKDAVNGGQLYGVKRDLEHQVDKVGANAAAMANLRPMEFDSSSKWNIAAAIGNYGSETAAAIGAFYRPNDNVMVNLSTAFGTGENMVGGGVSVRLGKGGNKLSREETNALKAQVADLTARMDALLSVLNPNMSKDFPDVPENHWAYEAVSRLAGNDIVQGYPDGEFHGERTMTRYEMAEIIYNALSRGAEAERKLVEEFKPELQAMAASEKTTAEKAKG